MNTKKKKRCKEESNGKLLNIISSVFLKIDLCHTSWKRKKFLTNTFNVRSSKEYLRGPGNRRAALDQSKRNAFNSASCDSSWEQKLGSTQGQNQQQQSSPGQSQHLPLTAQGHQGLVLCSAAPGGKAQPLPAPQSSLQEEKEGGRGEGK